MYFHCPNTARSSYVLWKRLINYRKIGLKHIRMFQHKDSNDRFGILTTSCSIGDLSSVMYLIKLGCDPTENIYCPIRWASAYGHLHLVKLLYSMGYYNNVEPNIAVLSAITYDNLRILKFFCNVAGYDPSSPDSHALEIANKYQPSIAKWIEKHYNPPRYPYDRIE